MIPDLPLLAALAVLGGLVALDGASVGQLMLSRPFAAATLGGLAAGRPGEGMVAGVVLEALHLAVLPVGAASYPEGGPPAVAAGAAFAASGHSYAALLGIVLFALGCEWVGGKTVERMRQLNVRFSGVAPGAAPGTVGRRVAAAVALDFARGALLALAAALLLGWLLGRVQLSRVPEEWARLALGLTVAAAVASALRLFGRGHWPFFAAGALGGAALLVLG
ncbi:MAG TPA: PTS sugar transporter subunit IIC [Longimicrobiaceae bacterium]|nr:PTS sugar transporter subunit IIC [Longimicrobiaceae bacterium]